MHVHMALAGMVEDAVAEAGTATEAEEGTAEVVGEEEGEDIASRKCCVRTEAALLHDSNHCF